MYVYLTRGLGRPTGFLFAWAEFWVVRPGNIGALAYVFADYATRLWHTAPTGPIMAAYAAVAVLILSVINILGVREGKWTQNLLTAVKVLGLAAIVAAGFSFAAPATATATATATGTQSVPTDFRLAMIMVLFAYGGWSEMAFVAAEVRNPRKNILRALLLGTAAVTLIYVLINLAFFHALGLPGMRLPGVAANVLHIGLGRSGQRLISLLICISALGAINGTILTGARIYYALGTEHRLFAWLGRWSPRWQTPARSLAIQAAVTLALVVGFGLMGPGFENLVIFTTPVFYIFFLLAGVALLVLRYRDPATPRPFRVPCYPWTPLVFCLCNLFMLWSSLSYACTKTYGGKPKHGDQWSHDALWSIGVSLGIMVVGVAFSWWDRRRQA
jgi:amino acid transporter